MYVSLHLLILRESLYILINRRHKLQELIFIASKYTIVHLMGYGTKKILVSGKYLLKGKLKWICMRQRIL